MAIKVEQQIDKRILELMNSNATMEQGLRLLMDTYQERMYWHIRGMVKNHQDTDDVLQNTFIKVYKGIQKFKEDAKLYTWLYRIATNESLTLLQRNQKKGMLSLDDDNQQYPQQTTSNPVPAEQIQSLLSLALDQLPAKQRAVFQLRYFDELGYADMSNITGTSEGALKASYHHAVKKIEAFIKQAHQ